MVAEIYYPQAEELQTKAVPTKESDFNAYQQYLLERSEYNNKETTEPSSEKSNNKNDKLPYCDGQDEIGCFQVRLYYDWFLIPGSCKCWRPDYFARYVRRKTAHEL